MNNICTSIEQSKKLVELCIDVNTADMCYCPIMNIDSGNNEGYLKTPECYSFSEFKNFAVPYLPAWSLSALLDLMPNVNGHYPELCRGKQTGQYYMWIENTFDTQMFDNPIDAAFEMVCWLLENNKI